MLDWRDFSHIWIVDYEYYYPTGNEVDNYMPICYCAKDIVTGRHIKHWIEPGETQPLYDTGEDSLFISYNSPAELKSHLVLNFPLPFYVCDLYVENRLIRNGHRYTGGDPKTRFRLLSVCKYEGITGGDTLYKKSMIERIIKGPPYTPQERQKILDYCEQDVILTEKLLMKLQDRISLPHAILRGRYLTNVSKMEIAGLPLDKETYDKLQRCWTYIKEELVFSNEFSFLYDNLTFKIDRFKQYLIDNKLIWDLTPSGRPKIDKTYFKKQTKIYPNLLPLYELRKTLNLARLTDLTVSSEGRNRCDLRAFSTITSRHAPSSTNYLFGNAKWLRHLLKPTEGKAIAYLDWSAQELGIAAALSKDKNFLRIYQDGDPYLAFGKLAGVIPPEGTRETHEQERSVFKSVLLGLNYGMGEGALAASIKKPLPYARYLKRTYHRVFKTYCDWLNNQMDICQLKGVIETKLGWRWIINPEKPTSLFNWSMQSHGSEMLRLAINFCFQENIQCIGCLHDAIIIEDDIDTIEETVTKAEECMTDASKILINLPLRVDKTVIKFPDRYQPEEEHREMWETVTGILNTIPESFLEAEHQTTLLTDWIEDLETLEEDYGEELTSTTSFKRGQEMMKPQTLSERKTLERIQKQTNLSYMEIMHLIRLARGQRYDIESLDWQYLGYDQLKTKILQDTQAKKSIKDLGE